MTKHDSHAEARRNVSANLSLILFADVDAEIKERMSKYMYCLEEEELENEGFTAPFDGFTIHYRFKVWTLTDPVGAPSSDSPVQTSSPGTSEAPTGHAPAG